MIRYDKIARKRAAFEQKIQELNAQCRKLETDYSNMKRALDSTLHEVRRFSGEISSYSETLSRELKEAGADAELRALCDTLFYTSGMITSRLAFTDLELNPAAVKLQVPLRTGIYKKFEKASHVLALKASRKHIKIETKGTSFLEIDALPSFELVPFVILDNAIKYSPAYQTIGIRFHESPNRQHLLTLVTSIGPYLDPDESEAIFNRGVRGRNAERAPESGEGLGLFLAKFLCDYHGVRITAESNKNEIYESKGVPLAPFTLRLVFDLASD